METNKTTSALNTLIEINNDRVAGYKTATDETKDTDLRMLFGELTQTSQENLSELRAEVKRLGGEPEEGTMLSGKIYRMWMDAKAALTGGDRGSILSSCEYGEDVALEAYDKVLETSTGDLTNDQLDMIRRQYTKLRQDHDRVKELRDRALA